MTRAAVCVCVRACTCLALPLTLLPASLPLSAPASPLPVHSVCSFSKLGVEGGMALAQALQHVLQLQKLHLLCALATARPARDGCRGSGSQRARARACACGGL